MFKHIRLTTNTSNWATCINPNLSDEEIEKAFLNKFFDVAVYPKEKREQVVKVEFLTDYVASFNGKLKESADDSQFLTNIKVSAYNEDEALVKLHDEYEFTDLVIEKLNTNIS